MIYVAGLIGIGTVLAGAGMALTAVLTLERGRFEARAARDGVDLDLTATICAGTAAVGAFLVMAGFYLWGQLR